MMGVNADNASVCCSCGHRICRAMSSASRALPPSHAPSPWSTSLPTRLRSSRRPVARLLTRCDQKFSVTTALCDISGYSAADISGYSTARFCPTPQHCHSAPGQCLPRLDMFTMFAARRRVSCQQCLPHVDMFLVWRDKMLLVGPSDCAVVANRVLCFWHGLYPRDAIHACTSLDIDACISLDSANDTHRE